MNDWTKWWWRQSNINSKYQQQQQPDTYETNDQDNWWRRSWCGYITGSNVGKRIQEKGRVNYEGSNDNDDSCRNLNRIESLLLTRCWVGVETKHIIVKQKLPCHATNHCYHYLRLLLLLPLQKNHHLLSAYLNKIPVVSKNIK